MCEIEIIIAYIKKHVYKHVCHNKNGHKTGVQEANVTKKKVKYI